jgi:hypothetical protein
MPPQVPRDVKGTRGCQPHRTFCPPRPQRAYRRNALIVSTRVAGLAGRDIDPSYLDSCRVICCPCMASDACRGDRCLRPTLHCISSLPAYQALVSSLLSFFARSSTPKFPEPACPRPLTACKRSRPLEAMRDAASLQAYQPASLPPRKIHRPPRVSCQFSRLLSCTSLGLLGTGVSPESQRHQTEPPGPFVGEHAAARTVRTLPCQYPCTTTTAKPGKGKGSSTTTTELSVVLLSLVSMIPPHAPPPISIPSGGGGP